METVKLSQANQALISNKNIVQKEQPKALTQKKNGKKLLAFGAIAVSALAIAGLIIKGKQDKLKKMAQKAVSNAPQASQKSQQAIESKQQEITQEIQKRFEQEKAIKRAQTVQNEFFEIMATPKKSAQESAQTILDIKQQEVDKEIIKRLEQEDAIFWAREFQDMKFAKMAKPEKSAKESFMDILKLKGFELEDISFFKGVAKLPDGTNFSGEVSKKLPNGDLIKLKYQDGLICESSREGSINFNKTYLRNKNTIEICKKSENSEAVTKFIFNPNSDKHEVILPNGTKKAWDSHGKLLEGTFKIAGVEKEFHWGQIIGESFPDGTERRYFENGMLEFERLPNGWERKYGYDKTGFSGLYDKIEGRKVARKPRLIYEKLPDGTSRKWALKHEVKVETIPVRKGYWTTVEEPTDFSKEWIANDYLYYESFPDGTIKKWSNYNGEPLEMTFFDGSGRIFHDSPEDMGYYLENFKIPDRKNCIEQGWSDFDDGYWAEYADGSRKEFSIWGQTIHEKLADGTERFYRDEFKDGCTNLYREVLPDGTERYWAVNDQLTFEKLPDGSEKAWYTNGQLKSEKTTDGNKKNYDRINSFIDKNTSQEVQKELTELEEEIENIRRTISATKEKEPEVAKELQVRLAQLERTLAAQKAQYKLFEETATPQKSAEESANFIRFAKANNMTYPFMELRENISYESPDGFPPAKGGKKEPGYKVYIQRSFAPKGKKEPELLITNSTKGWWYENYQKLFGKYPSYSSNADKTGDVPFGYYFDILEKEDSDVHHKISWWKGKAKEVIGLFKKPIESSHESVEATSTHNVSSSSHSHRVKV